MATRTMGSQPSGEPPAKKRRFFTEADDDVNVDGHGSHDDAVFSDRAGSSPGPASRKQNHTVSSSLAAADASLSSSSPQVEAGPSNDHSHPHSDPSEPFDQATFEAFVGNKVDSEVLDLIREVSSNDLEAAVNAYFDDTWKTLKKKKEAKAAFQKTSRSNTLTPVPHGPKPPDTSAQSARLTSVPSSRYIGAFGVEGWATRSGANLLNHGEVVRIERQKTQPPKKGTAFKRNDVIVRFTNDKGTEIGRLAKDTANWVSTLIDQKVCAFVGTCVYAPERLRTNDTIFLQLRCSLLTSAFTRSGFQLSDNRTTGVFEEKETTEERDLRLRQIALVRLFQEIGLNPSKMNAAAARHQRQGLLDAAEQDEKREKETPAKNKSEASGSSTPSEDEDGEELQQDQLDALYKKAQTFDFDTPEAEPAVSFGMYCHPCASSEVLVRFSFFLNVAYFLQASCSMATPKIQGTQLTLISHDSPPLPETSAPLDAVQGEKRQGQSPRSVNASFVGGISLAAEGF